MDEYFLPLATEKSQISMPIGSFDSLVLLEIGCKPAGKVGSLNRTQRSLEMDWRMVNPIEREKTLRINKFLLHYDPRKHLSLDDGFGNTLDFIAVFTEFPEDYLPRLNSRKINYLLRTVLTRAGKYSKENLRYMILNNDVKKLHDIIVNQRSNEDLGQFRGELVEGLGQYLVKNSFSKGKSLFRNLHLDLGRKYFFRDVKEVDGMAFSFESEVEEVAERLSNHYFLEISHRWH